MFPTFSKSRGAVTCLLLKKLVETGVSYKIVTQTPPSECGCAYEILKILIFPESIGHDQ